MNESLKHKNKLKIWTNRLLRLIVTLLLLWVMYSQLDNKTLLFKDWESNLLIHFRTRWFYLLAAIILMPLNYFMESLKWFILVNHFQAQDLKTSVKGVLTGVTAGMITPARLGDYVGKLMFIHPEHNWKAVWANFTTSVAQNLVTVIFGLIGLIFIAVEWTGLSPLSKNLLLTGSAALGLILFVLYHNLRYLVKLLAYLPDISWIRQIKQSMRVVLKFRKEKLNLVLLIAMGRYLIFLGQYLLLLKFWGIEFDWMLAPALAVVYLVQTLLPFPPLMGLLVRGEIALLVLGQFTSNGLLILSAALSIWLLNLLIPSLLGLYFLYRTDILKTLGLTKWLLL